MAGANQMPKRPTRRVRAAAAGGSSSDASEAAAASGGDYADGRDGIGAEGNAGADGEAPEAQATGLEAHDDGDTELAFSDQTVDDGGDDLAVTPARRGGKRLGSRRGGKMRPAAKDAAAAEKRQPARKLPKVDEKAVGGLLSLAEGFMVPQIGAKARFSPQERALIVPSLTGIIDRMTPDVAAKFSAVADPLLLATGLGMWGLRVFVANAPATAPVRPGESALNGVQNGEVTLSTGATIPAAQGQQPTPIRATMPPVAPMRSTAQPLTVDYQNGSAPVDDDLTAAWGTLP